MRCQEFRSEFDELLAKYYTGKLITFILMSLINYPHQCMFSREGCLIYRLIKVKMSLFGATCFTSAFLIPPFQRRFSSETVHHPVVWQAQNNNIFVWFNFMQFHNFLVNRNILIFSTSYLVTCIMYLLHFGMMPILSLKI